MRVRTGMSGHLPLLRGLKPIARHEVLESGEDQLLVLVLAMPAELQQRCQATLGSQYRVI